MVKKDKLGAFRELKGDLIERIDKALGALAEPEYIEEVIPEREIHHSKVNTGIEIKNGVRDGFIRVAVYARDGYGCLCRLALKGIKGMKDIPDYVRDHIRALNDRRELYFA